MKFLLDADQTAMDSIARRINAKGVTLIPCGTFAAYDKACSLLAQRTPAPGDRVILDSFTLLLSTTRGDFKHGTDATASVWDKKDLYFGDKQALNAYQAAGNMTMRWLKNLRNVGYDLCVVCHEDEALDESTMTTKRSPKANPEARDMLYAASTDIFRLTAVTRDISEIGTDGQPVVTIPKDTRLLYLRRTNELLAKYHVDIEQSPKIPDAIKDPTFDKLSQVLGKVPSFLVVYGLPGTGKTTFATS